MTSISNDSRLRERYRLFRILVIGRANAGKTTLLKRVCNTTDEPCIYDEEGKNLVRFPLKPTKSHLDFADNPSINKLEPTQEVSSISHSLVDVRLLTLLLISVGSMRSEEHTSELQSHSDLVCRL